jgi:hypothetical protein
MNKPLIVPLIATPTRRPPRFDLDLFASWVKGRSFKPARTQPRQFIPKPMIDSFIGACETLVSAVSGRGKNPTSGISRVGMPNGFFLNDLLRFGDGASRKTAISRGFTVELGEISAFSGGSQGVSQQFLTTKTSADATGQDSV